MKTSNVIVAFGFAALCVVCATVLIALGKATPAELWTLAGVGVGGGAGVALPTLSLGSGGAVSPSDQVSAVTVTGGADNAPAVSPAPAHVAPMADATTAVVDAARTV